MKRGQAWYEGIISETDPELLRLFADKIEWHIERQSERIEALETAARQLLREPDHKYAWETLRRVVEGAE